MCSKDSVRRQYGIAFLTTKDRPQTRYVSVQYDGLKIVRITLLSFRSATDKNSNGMSDVIAI